jgi:hypothetical protein
MRKSQIRTFAALKKLFRFADFRQFWDSAICDPIFLYDLPEPNSLMYLGQKSYHPKFYLLKDFTPPPLIHCGLKLVCVM